MKKWEGLQKKVESYLKRWNMIERGEHIVAGISGGADSVCLLFVLLRLQKKLGIRITVVHVNHMLRGKEADGDENFVRQICKEQGVPCRVFHIDVVRESRKRKMSEEETGREIRREIMQSVLDREKADKIAFAHHQGDNAETVIMNLCRGSRIKGMRGILPVVGNLIHPLLCLEKKEIEEALTERKISWRIDATNLENDYTRNRIRNRIMKEMQEINPKTIQHIAGMTEKISELWEYMEEKTGTYIQECVEEREDALLIRKEELKKIPKIFQEEVVREALEKICESEKDLMAVHVQMVLDLMEKQTGRKVSLPYGAEAIRGYEGIVIRKKRNKKETEEKSRESSFRMRIFDRIGDEKWPENPYTKWFDYDIIKNSLIMRTRREGDYITITEDGKRQTIKKFFVNQKIPAEERKHILLIADGNEIVWIVGYRQNKAYQITKKTKRIVEIEVYGGEKNGRDN